MCVCVCVCVCVCGCVGVGVWVGVCGTLIPDIEYEYVQLISHAGTESLH